MLTTTGRLTILRRMPMAPPDARRFAAPTRSLAIALLSFLGLGVLAGCDTPTGGRSLSEAARLRLTEAADRNNPDAPDQLTIEVLRQQAQQNPNSVVIQDRFAQAALAAGLPADAATAMRRAALIAGPTQTRLLDIGRAEIRAGNADGAIEAFRAAEVAGPPNPAVLGGLGLAYDMNGDTASAEAAHRRAVALAPQDWGLRGNLALSLMFAGRPADGIRVIGSAEGDSSAPRRARHNLALLLAADGQTDRAARILRNDMGPSQADAMMRDYQSFAQWAGASRRDPPRLLADRPDAILPPPPTPLTAAAPPARSYDPPAAPRAYDPPSAPSAYEPPSASRAYNPPSSPMATTPAPVGADVRAMEPISSPGDPGFVRPPRGRRGAAAPAAAASEPSGFAMAPPSTPPEPVRAPVVAAASVPEPARAMEPVPELAPVHAAAPPLPPPREAIASVPAPAPAAPAGTGGGGYQVQVAALGSEAEAQRLWETVSSRHASLLEGRESVITRFDRGDRVFYRLRLGGFASSAEAVQFCARLRAASQNCFTAAS